MRRRAKERRFERENQFGQIVCTAFAEVLCLAETLKQGQVFIDHQSQRNIDSHFTCCNKLFVKQAAMSTL